MLALLTDEQEMLRTMAASLASSVALANPGDLGEVDRGKGWHSLAEAGLLGLRARDDDGVPAASGVEVAVVAEALGGALAPLPYIGAGVLAPELLGLCGAPAPWLEEITAGTTRYALLLTPDLHGPAHAGTPTGAWGDALAFDADGAEYALALAGPAERPDVVRFRPADGFTPTGSADQTRPIARTTGPAGEPEIAGSLTPEALARWRALALTAACADAVGVMRAALAGVVAYAKERIAYEVPIGSFQAIQHLCADALVHTEAAASTTGYAAWAVDELAPAEALLAARTAKAQCGPAVREVTETVMQVYGGIGQTWEHIAHFFTRRALLDARLFGDADEQLPHIADDRLGRD